MKKILIVLVLVLVVVGITLLLNWYRSPKISNVRDEAQLAGLTTDYFRAADEDYFHDMDSGVALSPDEVVEMREVSSVPGR